MSEEEKLLKEAKKLPWEDRLLHKNWRVRNEANIDLAAFCDSITDPEDHRLRELGSEQDKEPEPEAASEVGGAAGPPEEPVADGR